MGGVITIPFKAFKTELSAEAYPALIGVGYICGVKIASYMFAGGLLAWFVLIPAIVTFGSNTVLYPGAATVAEMYASGGASVIWGSYIRYIGAGTVAAGGILSLIKALPMIVSTFVEAMKGMSSKGTSSGKRTERELDMRFVAGGALVITVLIWILPQVPVSLPGALIIVVFGFFFGAVASRIVGLELKVHSKT